MHFDQAGQTALGQSFAMMNIVQRLRLDGRKVAFNPRSACSMFQLRTMTLTSLESESNTIVATPGTVLTFLSPSSTHSRSAVKFLNKLFQLPRITRASNSSALERDSLDELHFGSSSSSSSWDSTACACPTSGTVLHFLSPSTGGESKESESSQVGHSPLHLIAVHGTPSPFVGSQGTSSVEEHYNNALLESRKRLAKSIQSNQVFPSTLEARLRGSMLQFMCNTMGRQLNPSWILQKNPTSTSAISPVLDLTPFPINNESENHVNIMAKEIEMDFIENGNNRINGQLKPGKLRELALPFFPGASSIQMQLSKSSLLRPLPGLYQCNSISNEDDKIRRRNTTNNPGLIFRPLPAAEEDMRLSPPSLVFQCNKLVDAQKLVEEELGGSTFKIGWRGHGQLGSLIVSHPSVFGLDLRICETPGEEWVLSAGFDEGEDSLLAGSLTELQSSHVVSEGKSDDAGTTPVAGDEKSGNGDCWVEVRANAKHPTGYLKQFTSSLFQKKSDRNKVAKPPDLPYE